MNEQINVAKLRLARLSKGYSQATLAKMASVSILTINFIEAKKTKMPHPNTLKKICDVLGINVLDIYKEVG